MITNSQIQDLLNELALHNCERSYKKLFIEMHGSLTAFAYSILKSSEDAEEVVSDFFVSVWQRRSSLPAIENPVCTFLWGLKMPRSISSVLTAG